MYSLDQELAFATQKIREQRAEIAALKEREADLHRLLKAQAEIIEEQRQEEVVIKAELARSQENYSSLLKDVISACGCTDGDDIRGYLRDYL